MKWRPKGGKPLTFGCNAMLGLVVCPERTHELKGGLRCVRCFIEDGGGPLDVGRQVQASNHHELLGSRALVMSVDGKGAALTASGVVRGVERK
jgi:hypothetical protein